jgi:hypothetical protein
MYDIQKNNTDDEINFNMDINDEKGKKSRRLLWVSCLLWVAWLSRNDIIFDKSPDNL